MEEGEEVYLNALNAASEADVGNFSSRVDPLTLGLASALNAVTLSAGLTCNLLVMVTVWRSPSLTASSINRAVMSLCLADLVCVAAEIPLAQAVLVANFRGAADSSTFGRICAIQAFSHTLSGSVQMMSFPVIAVERYFSIRQPFEKDRHLLRVNTLSGLTWCMGIGFSVLSTYFFPVTTLSFYCDTAVSRKSVDSLFHRIYYLMLPVGLTCLIITVGSYALIVRQVRRQNRKSFNRTASTVKGRDKRRALSYTGNFGNLWSVNPSPDPRRVSLPVKERGRVGGKGVAGSVEMEMVDFGARQKPKRPALTKQPALCIDDEEDEDEQQQKQGRRQQRPRGTMSRNHLAPPTCKFGLSHSHSSSAIRTNSDDSSGASSSATTAATDTAADHRSRLSTAVNSLDFDDDSNDEVVEDPNPRASALDVSMGKSNASSISVLAQAMAPLIAISIPTTEMEPYSRCQTPEPSLLTVASDNGTSSGGGGREVRGEERSRPPPPFHMRRCKSATTDGTSTTSCLDLKGGGGRLASWTPPPPRLRHGASLMSAFRASQRAFSVSDRRAREMGRRRSELGIAKKSCYIVLAFLALWLPLPLAVGLSGAAMYGGSGEVRREEEGFQRMLDLQLCAYCVGMLTAVSNPIVYALAIRSFRATFSKMARRTWSDLRNGPGCFGYG